ncbi:MAG: arsenate reductase family protein [Bacilli bacterium]|nr:arsenate reductase family protein [Bacilli bacterium]
MRSIKFIWYPKCSTCKRAKSYLERLNYSFDLRDIVLDKLSYNEVKSFYEMSGKNLKSFFNTSGLKYRELGLKDKLDSLSDDEKLKILSSDGMLVKRPILVFDDRVFIGFREKEWSDYFENNKM